MPHLEALPTVERWWSGIWWCRSRGEILLKSRCGARIAHRDNGPKELSPAERWKPTDRRPRRRSAVAGGRGLIRPCRGERGNCAPRCLQEWTVGRMDSSRPCARMHAGSVYRTLRDRRLPSHPDPFVVAGGPLRARCRSAPDRHHLELQGESDGAKSITDPMICREAAQASSATKSCRGGRRPFRRWSPRPVTPCDYIRQLSSMRSCRIRPVEGRGIFAGAERFTNAGGRR